MEEEAEEEGRKAGLGCDLNPVSFLYKEEFWYMSGLAGQSLYMRAQVRMPYAPEPLGKVQGQWGEVVVWEELGWL